MRKLIGVLVVVLSAVTFPAAAVAAPQPTDWCGPGESAVDLPDTVGGPQIHVIYAYPSDAPDNFGRWVTPLVRDLAAVDSWWQGQDPTRTLRLQSGDICILAGALRRAYHGVDRIIPGSSRLIPGGGRVNLTLRRALA